MKLPFHPVTIAVHVLIALLSLFWLRFGSPLIAGIDLVNTIFAVDDDFGLDVMQLVAKRGYFIQEHQVVTQDDYLLTLYRMPKSYDETQRGLPMKNKPVVLLMHGLLDSSFTYVANFRDQSLAFILADLGYDVWLGNNRGTSFSRNHKFWTTNDWQFWDFSWAELAQYDLPAILQYVLAQTRRETISYIGHSEGNMQAFVAFSENQEMAKRVSFFAALGPVAFLGYDRTPAVVNGALYFLREFSRLFPYGAFLPRTPVIAQFFSRYLCNPVPHVCERFIETIVGPSVGSNSTRLPVFLAQTPAGSSIKNMLHFAQIIFTKQLRNYDYGCKCDRRLDKAEANCRADLCANKAKYGSMDPPSYDLTQLKYPRLGFIEGDHDFLAAAKNINHLRKALPNGTVVYTKRLPFNHVDFTWSPEARTLFYDEMIQVMQLFEGKGY